MSNFIDPLWVICRSKGANIPYVLRGPRLRPFILEREKFDLLETAGYKVEIVAKADVDEKGRIIPRTNFSFERKEADAAQPTEISSVAVETAVFEPAPETETVKEPVVEEEEVKEVSEETTAETEDDKGLEDENGNEVDLDSLDKAQIIEILEENEVEFVKGSTKPVLLALLKSLM